MKLISTQASAAAQKAIFPQTADAKHVWMNSLQINRSDAESERHERSNSTATMFRLVARVSISLDSLDLISQREWRKIIKKCFSRVGRANSKTKFSAWESYMIWICLKRQIKAKPWHGKNGNLNLIVEKYFLMLASFQKGIRI